MKKLSNIIEGMFDIEDNFDDVVSSLYEEEIFEWFGITRGGIDWEGNVLTIYIEQQNSIKAVNNKIPLSKIIDKKIDKIIFDYSRYPKNITTMLRLGTNHIISPDILCKEIEIVNSPNQRITIEARGLKNIHINLKGIMMSTFYVGKDGMKNCMIDSDEYLNFIVNTADGNLKGLCDNSILNCKQVIFGLFSTDITRCKKLFDVLGPLYYSYQKYYTDRPPHINRLDFEEDGGKLELSKIKKPTKTTPIWIGTDLRNNKIPVVDNSDIDKLMDIVGLNVTCPTDGTLRFVAGGFELEVKDWGKMDSICSYSYVY